MRLNLDILYKLVIVTIIGLYVIVCFADTRTFYVSNISIGLDVTFNGAVPEGTDLNVFEGFLDPVNNDRTTIKMFEPKFYTPNSENLESIVLFVDYEDQEIINMDESDLQLYEYDEINQKWIRVESAIDVDNNQIRASLDSENMGAFGLVYEPGSGGTPIETIAFKTNIKNDFWISSNKVFYENKKEDYVKCRLLNLQGKIIETIYDGNMPKGLNSVNINQNILPGIYIIELNDNDNINILKINKR